MALARPPARPGALRTHNTHKAHTHTTHWKRHRLRVRFTRRTPRSTISVFRHGSLSWAAPLRRGGGGGRNKRSAAILPTFPETAGANAGRRAIFALGSVRCDGPGGSSAAFRRGAGRCPLGVPPAPPGPASMPGRSPSPRALSAPTPAPSTCRARRPPSRPGTSGGCEPWSETPEAAPPAAPGKCKTAAWRQHKQLCCLQTGTLPAIKKKKKSPSLQFAFP